MMMMAMISMACLGLWIHHLPSFPANTWQVGISEKKKKNIKGRLKTVQLKHVHLSSQ